MATLLHLPNELLLVISHCLDNNGLCSLALVCRQTLDAAQEVLYTKPKVPSPYFWSEVCRPGPRFRLFRLARTLLERPALALRVKWLSLTAGYNISDPREEESWEQTYGLAVTVINGLESASPGFGYRPQILPTATSTTIDTWTLRSARWMEALKDGTDTAWCGVILALCSNLETLGLEVLSELGIQEGTHYLNHRAFHSEPIEALFGTGPAYSPRTTLTIHPQLLWFEFELGFLHAASSEDARNLARPEGPRYRSTAYNRSLLLSTIWSGLHPY